MGEGGGRVVRDGVMGGKKEKDGREGESGAMRTSYLPPPPSPAASFIRLTLSSILHSVERCHRAHPRTSPCVVT